MQDAGAHPTAAVKQQHGKSWVLKHTHLPDAIHYGVGKAH